VSARAVCAAAAALAFAGCAFNRAPQPQPSKGEWAQQRDDATRRDLLYDGLNHRATGTATFLSVPVREARASRLAKWLGWTQEELDARLAQERSEAAEGEEFFLSLYTAEPKDNDLDAPKSIWRVSVRVDGEDIVSSKVTAIDREATVVMLFPYIGPFDTLYRVVVPAAPSGALAGRKFTFELASARGKLLLDFGAPGGSITPQEVVPPP
jgi:hypothetical protein